eukprot:7253655-Alexandrium_andersonii.AAC.1
MYVKRRSTLTHARSLVAHSPIHALAIRTIAPLPSCSWDPADPVVERSKSARAFRGMAAQERTGGPVEGILRCSARTCVA